MIEYVCGFIFNLDKSKVALIEKKRPKWQEGLLNGIGGKIEENEHPLDTICREVYEETGYKTFYYDWKEVGTLRNLKSTWMVHFFKSHSQKELDLILKTTTDEDIIIVNINELDYMPLAPNLKWLVRLASEDTIKPIEIITKE